MHVLYKKIKMEFTSKKKKLVIPCKDTCLLKKNSSIVTTNKIYRKKNVLSYKAELAQMQRGEEEHSPKVFSHSLTYLDRFRSLSRLCPSLSRSRSFLFRSRSLSRSRSLCRRSLKMSKFKKSLDISRVSCFTTALKSFS